MGMVYIALMIFMGLAAMNSQANLLFGVFGLMIGVMVISGVISRAVLSRLRIGRQMPETAVVGQPLKIGYECKNLKRFWPSFSVTIAELDGSEAFVRQPVAYMLHAAARQTAIAPTEAMPRRRGLHALDRLQISTSFPFGFIKRARERRLHDTLLVYPALGRVSLRLLMHCRSSEQGWAQSRPQSGGSNEFYGVKEFRAGESPRFIHWKRSARTGVLVSKEMTRIAPPRLALLVDTCLGADDPTSRAAVERAIAMAASVASHALDGGMVVGLCGWSGRWITLPTTRGKRHCRELMSILARMKLNLQHGPEQLLENARSLLNASTTAMLFTPAPSAPPQASGMRGLVVLSAVDPRAQAYFEFDSDVDFSVAMPAEPGPLSLRK